MSADRTGAGLKDLLLEDSADSLPSGSSRLLSYSSLLGEFSSLFGIFIISRSAEVGAQFVTAFWMSQRGEDYLEASNLVTKYVNFLYVSSAISMYVTAILQKAEKVEVREEMRPKILLATSFAALTIAVPISLAMIFSTEKLLVAMGQPEVPSKLTQDYVNGFVGGGGILLGCLSVACQQTSFAKGGNWRWLVVGVNLVRQAINLLLVYGMLFGKLGMPDYGAMGVGLARSISTALDFLAFIVIFAIKGMLPIRRVFKESLKLYGKTISKAMAIGSRSFLEQLADFVATIMIGLKNGDALAASEIVAQYWQLFNVIIMTAAQSTSIVVAKHKFDLPNARRMTTATLVVITSCLTLLITALTLSSAYTGRWMEGAFIDHGSQPISNFTSVPSNTTSDIKEIAHNLLWLLIPMVSLNAVKGMTAGSLRGLGEFNYPLMVSAVSMLVIGSTLSGVLCFPVNMSAFGVYLGSTGALACAAVWMLAKNYSSLQSKVTESNRGAASDLWNADGGGVLVDHTARSARLSD